MSDSTPKFRVGDIVRCIDAHPGFSGQPGHIEIGKLYTVRKLDQDGDPMLFERDEMQKIGWPAERFELVDDATAHMHGDTFTYDALPGTVTLTDTPNVNRAGLINQMVEQIHTANVEAGWYTDLTTGERKQRNIGEMLMLIVTEVAEAMEGHRKDLMDDKLPHRKMMEVELADTVIRIFDLAGYCNYDLGGAIQEKLAFNAKRSDHKIENRKAEGGKKC